ncbi:MAG: FAD-dependent oxidoreductase, partial [Stenotrophomonas sp.]
MSARNYDVVVLGGGSGGLAAAFRAASYGAKVAMLEPAPLGGTCVNVGCVPKKAMWLAADLAERIALARRIGFDVPAEPALAWSTLLDRRQQYIANIHASYQKRLDETGVVRISNRGYLIDPHTVQCDDGTQFRAEHIVIATGAHPLKPELPGAELGGVSDDFFALQARPDRVALVGGGYIAVELAGVLRALGSEVALLVRGQRLLGKFDAEVSDQLAENLRLQGVELHFGCKVEALQRQQQQIRAQLHNGPEQAVFDTVLFATGRGPNTRGLGLEQAGVKLGEKGQVEVDDYQNTSVP